MKTLVEKINRTLSWHSLNALSERVIHRTVTIQQIPAPTFFEGQRAAFIAETFRQLGLENVDVDDRYNVYGCLAGKARERPAVMLSAHSDTVFPLETDLKTRRENGRIYGPGLGDNSLGVAALIGLAEFLKNERIQPACDVWFIIPSREEGLGDLGGMKQAYERMADKVGAVINVEGLALGHIYHGGIAVRRLHITAHGRGGHSWLHYGRSSATHGIIQLGAYILGLTPPQKPRTTFNIGMIEGGQGINVIATEAGMWLDLRSEQSEALAALEAEVHQGIKQLTREDLQFKVEVVGDRPAGEIAIDHPLVQGAIHALAMVGLKAGLETGSTDANIPLASGCPAVTIGITRGGNAHRLDEYIETEPVIDGMRQLILLTVATARYLTDFVPM